MGRIATQPQTPAAEPALNDQAIEVLGAKASELATLNAEQATRAIAIAQQVGYEGSMTVGALEDEIRFYQRRTVEAILETGKRLLVLKELTPHGEFAKRVELLGFADRTARRFMQAAAKTAKSANLAVLSTTVKNASAFLELVTHDDDVLEGLQEMDDFDRMSASELRQAARELAADKTATEQLLTAKNKKIDELTRKVKKFDIHTDWPDQVRGAVELTDEISRGMEKSLDMLMQACTQAMEATPQDEAQQQVFAQGTAALAARVRDAMARQREVIEAADLHFKQTLGHFLED
jgi:hypothetical protein